MSTPRTTDDYIQRMKTTLREQDQLFTEIALKNAELEKRTKELEYENWQLRSIIDNLKKTAKTTDMKYRELEATIDVLKVEHENFQSENPLVVCLLDGDGCIFAEEYLKQGHDGGALAAEQLSRAVTKYLRANVERSYPGAKIVTMVFLSKTGMESVLYRNGICRPDEFGAFMNGFGGAHPLFSVVDVGTGKEAADHKLRGKHLETFTKLPQTVKVFFGGGHDNGYYGTLAALQTLGHRNKLVIVQSYSQIGREISALKLPLLDIPGLFMSEKLDRRPILRKSQAVSDSILMTLDQQPPLKSPSRKKKAKARHNAGSSISSIDQILYPMSNHDVLEKDSIPVLDSPMEAAEIQLPCVDHHFSDRGCIASTANVPSMQVATMVTNALAGLYATYRRMALASSKVSLAKMGRKKKTKSTTDQNELEAPAAPPPAPEPKPPVDPKWVWPPFPTPPPGISIIPFHQFEPKGIVISLDDDSELDGDGVKTVMLQVKHGFGGHRAKKGKKKKNPLEDIGEEELQKMTWDKRWELAEEMRTARPLDPDEDIIDRLTESIRLFHSGRRWDQVRQQLWDQFKIYIGVLTGVKKPQKSRRPTYSDDDEDAPLPEKQGNLEQRDGGDEEDDVDDDDEVMHPEPAVDLSAFSAKEKEQKEQLRGERMTKNTDTYHRLRSLAEERTDYWISDPETATKIFLSSYFRDRGLMWSEHNTKDMPLLLCFYLRFVIRNKLFAEKDFMKAYEKALLVAERASIELPFTYRISRAFPDRWGRACVNLWRKRHQSEWERAWPGYSAEQPEAPKSEEIIVTEDMEKGEGAKLVVAEYDLGEERKTIREKAAATVDDSDPTFIPEATIEEVEECEEVDSTIKVDGEVAVHPGEEPLLIPPLRSDQPPLADGFGTFDSAKLVEDWGDISWKDPPEEKVEEAGWGTVEVVTTADCIDEVTADSLPNSHIPIRGEKSTRMLIQILEPDESAKDPLSKTLAKLVFQPWSIPNMDSSDSLVQAPSMLTFGEEDEIVQASKRNARSFDPTKHNIHVYVDKAAVTECRVGMAIGATWIQVAKRVEPSVTIEKPTGGKGKKGGGGDEWWYMEGLDWALPGYWTNNEPARDTTLPHNNAEYAYEYSD
ncbi:hypothetical protein FRC17_010911 [Serendipita sp. 399]|nr:hypothetical protein FRC17_010911 [Serendipita sp. 399]